MDFDELFANVCEALRREQRISYRALRRRFELSDDDLEDLKVEIIEAKQLAVDENDRILVWLDKAATTPEPAPTQPSEPDITQETEPTEVEPPAVESYAPEAERRQLTVMFCDLVGSTSLSGELDPEDLREVVRAYQAICTEVVERFGGWIAQHLGDGILCYLGYPQAHEDDAQRAVRAGLGIIDSMKALNERLEQDKGIQLAVRIGIHTGLTVIGDIGTGVRQEQLALGETPNVAARIQGLAEPDNLCISDATYRIVQGFFDCEPLSEHDLRGVSQAIAIYRVLQVSEAKSRLDLARTKGLTPLTGRDTEVNLLINRWTQTKSDGGQVVLLNAEPGLGKSRLVQALKESLTNESHTRLECRSSPYYQNSALYPVITLIQRALRWEQGDSDSEKLRKLEQVLSLYRIPLGETVPLFGPLLSLSVPEDRYEPLNLTSQQQRQKTLETIVEMVLELSEQQPVVFIVEDLHWADPSTLVLLDLLVDQMPTAPIFTLFTCRPEFQSQWSNRSYFTQVTLNRLSHDDIEEMVSRVTGGKSLPPEVMQQLVDKTDGVPLYVEEMTKAVLESGLLKEFDDQYELVDSLSALTIPSTLQDSLMARLDRLASAKAVAQYAAVIGRQFSYTLLQAIVPWDEATLQHELGRLVESELVYQRGVVPDATYTFKHALVQDTAYDSLLRATRQQYHRQIANVLEEQFAGVTDNQPELLAHHWVQGEAWEKGFGYLTQSGEKARQAYANQEAIAFYTQAIEASRRVIPALDAATILPVYEGKGLVWMLLTQYDDAIADFQMMRQTARTSNDQLKEGESLCHLSFAHWLKFSEDQVPFIEQYAQEALEIARQTGDQKIHARGLISLGFVPQVRGNLEESDRYHSAALEISRHEGYRDTQASSLLWLSAHAYWRGDFSHARHLGQEGLTTARDMHDGLLELFALAFLSITSWSAGDYAQALTMANEGRAKAEERDSLFIGGRMMNTLGWFYREFGAASQSVAYDQESLEHGRASGVSNVETSALINLGQDYLTLGQYDHALSYLGPTLERVENELFGTERWRWKMRLRIGLADLALMTGDPDQALRHVEEALKDAQRTSSQKYIALGWALRGKIIAKLGNTEAAGTELQRAFILADQLQSPSLIYPIAYDFGQWHESTGNEQAAATLYGKAKTTIDQMITAVEDEALRFTFLESGLVQEIHDHVNRLGG